MDLLSLSYLGGFYRPLSIIGNFLIGHPFSPEITSAKDGQWGIEEEKLDGGGVVLREWCMYTVWRRRVSPANSENTHTQRVRH